MVIGLIFFFSFFNPFNWATQMKSDEYLVLNFNLLPILKLFIFGNSYLFFALFLLNMVILAKVFFRGKNELSISTILSKKFVSIFIVVIFLLSFVFLGMGKDNNFHRYAFDMLLFCSISFVVFGEQYLKRYVYLFCIICGFSLLFLFVAYPNYGSYSNFNYAGYNTFSSTFDRSKIAEHYSEFNSSSVTTTDVNIGITFPGNYYFPPLEGTNLCNLSYIASLKNAGAIFIMSDDQYQRGITCKAFLNSSITEEGEIGGYDNSNKYKIYSIH
jgi:hypothetical protein